MSMTILDGNPSLSPAITTLSMLESISREMASRMKWEVDTTQKTTEDFTPYLKEKLVVSLEMELDWGASDTKALVSENWTEAIGLDEDEGWWCKTCGVERCYKHDPPKMIRETKTDCTIHGRELIVWGMAISSEEFARRLPLAGIRRHFHVEREDSMHTHTIISEYTNPSRKPLPVVIAKNVWQLFRAYYPAWVYIFGNYAGRFLRSDWAKWTNYKTSATSLDWINASQNREGLYFGSTRFEHSLNWNTEPTFITKLDAEIRTQDASTHLDQIIAARAMPKALFLRASDLANEGLIDFTGERLTTTLNLIHDLNNAANGYNHGVEETFGQSMKTQAYELVGQLAPYLDRFETACIKQCIDKPVRHRRYK